MDETKTKTLTSFMVAALLLITISIVYAGAAYMRNWTWADEFTLWEDVTAKSPVKSRGHTYLGIAHARAKNLKKAYHSLSTAVLLSPTDVEARYNMGVYYKDVKNYPLAKAELRYVISERPDLIEPYLALADIFSEFGEETRSASLLMRALKRWPNDTRVLLQVAISYGKTGRLEEAITYFSRVLSIDGKSAPAMTGLGNTYYLQGRIDKALEYYTRSINSYPRDPEPIYNIALIYERRGRYDEALAHYEKFIEVASRDEENYSASIIGARRSIGIIRFRTAP